MISVSGASRVRWWCQRPRALVTAALVRQCPAWPGGLAGPDRTRLPAYRCGGGATAQVADAAMTSTVWQAMAVQSRTWDLAEPRWSLLSLTHSPDCSCDRTIIL